MYSDNSLTPREAIRLCALGILAYSANSEQLSYDELVYEVRHFVSRITGPSLELMGESIELLRYEGLVEGAQSNEYSNLRLSITDEGIKVLKLLLQANIRAGSGDLSELVLALKFRFLQILPIEKQILQIENLIDICDVEISRLEDLKTYHSVDESYIGSWLDHRIQALKLRLQWLIKFGEKLTDCSDQQV